MDNEEKNNIMDEITQIIDENPTSNSPIKGESKFKNPFFIIGIIVVIIAVAWIYFNEYAYNFFEKIESGIENIWSSTEEEYYEYNEEPKLSEDEQMKQFEEYKKNVEISRIVDAEGDCHIILTNNNDVELKDLELYVIYYNDENVPIEIENERFYGILPKGKTSARMYDTPTEFSRYEFLLKTDYYEYGSDYNISCPEDVGYVDREEEDYIIISCINKSDSQIDSVGFMVTFYDENDNIVSIQNTYDIDIRKNEEFDVRVYKPFDVEYSRYEIVLENAYRENY